VILQGQNVRNSASVFDTIPLSIALLSKQSNISVF